MASLESVRARLRALGARPTSAALPVRTRAEQESDARARRWQRRVIVAVIGVTAMLVLLPTFFAFLSQRSELANAQQSAVEQRARVASLEKQVAAWRSDTYLMQQARERLKFVKVGEKAYTVVDASPDGEVDPVTRTVSAPTAKSWYGRLWESMRLADSPGSLPDSLNPTK